MVLSNHNRNCHIDVFRFIGIIIIMTHHSYNLGRDRGYPFDFGWIYVEFFLILMGYFTVNHLVYMKEESIEDVIHYTLNKYLGYMPYVIPTVFCQYLFHSITVWKASHNLIESFISYLYRPSEMLLLSASFKDKVEAGNAPIWFLSATFLMFPLFCGFVKKMMQWKSVLVYFLFIVPVFCYGYWGWG